MSTFQHENLSPTLTLGDLIRRLNRLFVRLVLLFKGFSRDGTTFRFQYDVESQTGVVLTAPNGSRWRVTVSNTGSLSTTAL